MASSSDKTCFICGGAGTSPSSQGRSHYLKQLVVLKGFFTTKEEQETTSDPIEEETCANCVQEVQAVWELTHQILGIRRDIAKIVARVKELMLKNDTSSTAVRTEPVADKESQVPSPRKSRKRSPPRRRRILQTKRPAVPKPSPVLEMEDNNASPLNQEGQAESSNEHEEGIESPDVTVTTTTTIPPLEEPLASDAVNDSITEESCDQKDNNEDSSLDQPEDDAGQDDAGQDGGPPSSKKKKGPRYRTPLEHKTPCPHCFKRFVGGPNGVADHIRRIHNRPGLPPERRPHPCQLCPRKFFTAAELSIHTGKKHNTFPCSLCGKGLISQKRWAIHEALLCKVEGWTPEKLKTEFGITLRTCSHPGCDKVFGNPGTMQKHLETHTGSRPHTCAQCGLGFSQKNTLSRHLTRCGRGPDEDVEFRRKNAAQRKEWRKKDKPFCCRLCGPAKYFIKEASYKGHLARVHPAPGQEKGGARSEILCDLCGVAMHPSQMTRHRKRVHLQDEEGKDGKKKHVCELCGEVYWTRQALRLHYSGAHGGVPGSKWGCDQCPRRFWRERDLKKHIDAHSKIVTT